MKTLKERLTDWQDFDGAEYELGVVLGLWPEFGAPPHEDQWHGVKGIMWSNNPTGNALGDALIALSDAGMLLRDEGNRFKWNPQFTTEE